MFAKPIHEFRSILRRLIQRQFRVRPGRSLAYA